MLLISRALSLFSATGDSCDPSAKSSFFGLTPWYEYLDGETDAFNKCVAKFNGIADIWLIALAVIDSLLKIAGLVAVGFVIYGGFQYITSNGEPERTKSAKDSILNALIGLVISIAATMIVSFIARSLT